MFTWKPLVLTLSKRRFPNLEDIEPPFWMLGNKKPSRPGWFFIGWRERQGPSYHRPWGGCWLRDSTMAMRMAIRLDISISPMAMGNVTRM